MESLKIYEFTTWAQGSPKWDEKNRIAMAAAKACHGTKWTVSIGERGPRTFMVLGAESREAAKAAALDFVRTDPRPGRIEPLDETKIAARNVTTSKKYS